MPPVKVKKSVAYANVRPANQFLQCRKFITAASPEKLVKFRSIFEEKFTSNEKFV